jgi:hypothetical protein
VTRQLRIPGNQLSAICCPVSEACAKENATMLGVKTLPPEINRTMLAGFVSEVDGREAVLRAMIGRFEQRYGSLKELEA